MAGVSSDEAIPWRLGTVSKCLRRGGRDIEGISLVQEILWKIERRARFAFLNINSIPDSMRDVAKLVSVAQQQAPV